jgi:hypothetical protein
MDSKKKYTPSTKTIAERLEHLEKCCEESTKFKLESEKKIASLEKTCEEYKKNIFYLMTQNESQGNGFPELPKVKRYISQSVMFNYISENIDLFMDDNYWNTFDWSQHSTLCVQPKKIIFHMLNELISSEGWNIPAYDEYENRYESIRNNEKLLKKVIQIYIKRKMSFEIIPGSGPRKQIELFNVENFKNLIDMIRNDDKLRIEFQEKVIDFSGMTREMRNSVADKLERVMKSIKDDEDKSKKGDDFPSDGRKKSKRSKRSKRKNKSRKK